ncbi:MAG: PHP domain-containing protein, partial [Crenarchaeota archaeon]|nr:PHP domain-containing protein [Thermoproteota archaeon]
MTIDLHIHSNNSDGVFSVKKIINTALKRKIDLMSITDHDSIAGQLQAIE